MNVSATQCHQIYMAGAMITVYQVMLARFLSDQDDIY